MSIEKLNEVSFKITELASNEYDYGLVIILKKINSILSDSPFKDDSIEREDLHRNFIIKMLLNIFSRKNSLNSFQILRFPGMIKIA